MRCWRLLIFRGDGKHNITEGNCFSTYLGPRAVNGHASARFMKTKTAAGTEAVTRALMNPPFALRGSDEHEYRFVSRALSMMADGTILFSLLPLDAFFGSRDEKVWRRDELLRDHTLLSVITLPDELFYPAAQKQVAAIIVKKGNPHPKEQPVFWARIARDGHLKVKSRRMPALELRPARQELDQIPLILPSLHSFIVSPKSVSVNTPKLCKTAPIDFDDPLLELLPEAYLDTEPPTATDLARAVNDMVRETAAFLVRLGKESKAGTFDETD